jgi:hypothetical protein
MQEIGENLRSADGGVLGRGEQGEIPFDDQFTKVRNCSGVHIVGKLAPVTLCELGELVWFMAIPLAKLARGGDVLTPFIETGGIPAEASWPQPVDKDS